MIRQRTRLAVPARRIGVAGRVGMTLFFLAWCTIATVILALMARQAVRDAAPWFWKATDCTIVQSGIAEADGRYALNVRYTYAAGPLSAVEAPVRTGNVYARGYNGDADYEPAQRLAIRYAPGTRATCYVDPSNPDEAVLARPVSGVIFMLPLPLLFLAIGVGGLWYTWRGAGKGSADPAAAPISSGDRAGRRGAWVAVAFFGVFLVVGVSVLSAMGGKAVKVFAARSWAPVQATVVKSDVRSHRGDDSTTYSPNILYRYTVGGREYRSNRYSLFGGSGSGYDAKRQVVSRYPPGARFTAYVDPADPVEAVIERGPTAEMFVLLVPLVFAIVGAGGIYFSLRSARGAADASALRSRTPSAGRYVPAGRSASRAGRLNGGRVPLNPRQSPGLKLVGVTFAAVFWNGIVSVFVYQLYKGWASGRPDWCLTVFMVPFVGVGLALAIGCLHALLALFNPRCALTADRETVAPGDTLDLRWSFSGRSDAIHRLVLRVEGREEATYRRGTDTYTDKNVFYVRGLLDTTRPAEVRAGGTKWTVPPGTMHSFAAPNNRVVWVLCLHGHVAGRPDVKDEYVLTVAPLPPSRVGAPAVGRVGPTEAGAPQAAPLSDGEGASWT
jgi:hypothetical protein